MSEELKPCPWCGGAAKVFQKYPDPKRSNWRVICDNASDCAMDPYNDFETPEEAAAAWNLRASPTPPTTEGREALEAARRIVAWDDGGRLADDEWLVEQNETAIIAICRVLLSSPRVEDVRRKALRDAIFAVDQRLGNASPQREWDHEDHVREEARVQAINAILNGIGGARSA